MRAAGNQARQTWPAALTLPIVCLLWVFCPDWQALELRLWLCETDTAQEAQEGGLCGHVQLRAEAICMQYHPIRGSRRFVQAGWQALEREAGEWGSRQAGEHAGGAGR